jgi:hypothetical protein
MPYDNAEDIIAFVQNFKPEMVEAVKRQISTPSVFSP